MKMSKGNFNLEIKSGSIKKNQIICLLGENGVGKTTFLRILAGKEENLKIESISDLKTILKP